MERDPNATPDCIEEDGDGLAEMQESTKTAKTRKPYTITKQRERWTDEEHQKFVDALKLYGRAWRRIEGKPHCGKPLSRLSF
ncbi:hypothetical protein V8C86DRAFT_2560498 [Haematococcus lacustris]